MTVQPRAWLATLFFFAALAAANFIGADASGTLDVWQRMEAPAFGILFFVWWLAVFASARAAVVAALLAFAWWWPVELYVRANYGSPLSAQFVGMALETQPSEFGEFLITYWPLLLAGVALIALIAVPALLITRRHPVRWTHGSRWAALILLPGAALAMWAFFESQEPAWLQPDTDPFLVAPLAFWSDKWRSVFPLTMPLAARRYHEDAQRIAELRSRASGFRFGARTMGQPLDAVVLVIGESSRADRWSLNGYARPTNPLLQQRANLVFFSNMVSPSVATRYAVPAIISRQPEIDPSRITRQAEPSLVTAFKEAGYRTAWLSNQSMSGFYDTSIALHSREAQVTRFLNPAAYMHEGSYDEVLVKPLEDFLQTQGPAMAVVHTLGSHFNYGYRYPPPFDRFKPSGKTGGASAEGSASRAVETSNAYDNTILYTDYVLDRLMTALNAAGKRSALVFISDHGEDVDEPGCPAGGPIRTGKWSYRVPALVWMSDALARERGAQLALLKARANQPLQSTAVFQTVLDLAGIELAAGGAARTSSLLAPTFAPAPRMVIGSTGRLVDFDSAEQRNGCRIAAP